MTNNNFYILTGAPGVGKTTLLKSLQKRHFKTVNEPAREIIAEQRLAAGEGLWNEDRELFLSLMLERFIINFKIQDLSQVTFFDRGIPDVTAYASNGDVKVSRLNQALGRYKYNPKVFLLEPWREIYKQDNERTMSFEETIVFQNQIEKAYKTYTLVKVPKISIEKRVEFIAQEINK